MLSCLRYQNRLGAYLDGELTERQQSMVEAHLESCETCRMRLEEIRNLDVLFQDTLPVPPVPDGLATRIMAEARRRQSVVAHETLQWNPLQWIAKLSAPMQVATCVTVLLAVIVGWSLDGGWLTGGQVSTGQENDLYGLEWFEPTLPGSIGSVYIAMADEDYGKGRRQ